MQSSSRPPWLLAKLSGLLLDITGVVYDNGSTGPCLIDGSLDAVNQLKAHGIPLRFCTNESQLPLFSIVKRLRNLGFVIDESEVFSPIPAAKKLIKKRNLRPFPILHDVARVEFNEFNQSDPNCVLLGDAADAFTYEKLNMAFQILQALDEPILIAMGYGKFYMDNGGLALDVGSYSKILEFACDMEPIIVGKPSPDFFLAALEDMGVCPREAVMIGDDIVSDVAGAQKCGIRGVQVRTGKFRQSWERHDTIVPDAIVDNLAQAVDLILKWRV